MDTETAFDKAHAVLAYIGSAVEAAKIMVRLGHDIVEQSAIHSSWVAQIANQAATEIADLMNQEQ